MLQMYRKFFKRLIDLIMALLLTVLLSPILVIVSILIKIDSKGPVLFKQERSGKNNKKFVIYKFRSMVCNNDFYNTSEEDKVTRIGRIIRKTSLDELPQMFNIIKGDMSFIGPRPWVVDYARYFTKDQMRRLEVLPGITGLAQCSGRNNLNIIDRINIDVNYADNVSFKLDVMIVFKTIKCILKGEGFSNTKSAIHDELRTLKNQNKKVIKKVHRAPNKTSKKNSSNNSDEKELVLVGSGV